MHQQLAAQRAAVVLLDARGFKPADFARSHPGGALGRKLLVHVADLMLQGDALPLVAADTPFIDMMRTMSAKGGGLALVVDSPHQPGQRLLGIFTDGDLRRQVERGTDLRTMTAAAVMQPRPRTIRDDALAVAAAELMELQRISSVAVLDAAGALVGLLSIGDLMRAKVI